MSVLQALLWDVDGTMAETERDGHRVAFNLAFAALGLPWSWDQPRYGQLLRVAGGRERLLHDMATREGAPVQASDREALAHRLHVLKNAMYADIVRAGGIALRPGVLRLMQECRDGGLRMGIATTTSRQNVAVLLRANLGQRWEEWFDTAVCGEDVVRKKPDPEVFTKACEALGVPPRGAVAIEDSPDGAAAARAAGLQVIVTRSCFFSQHTIPGVTAIGPGLDDTCGWEPAAASPAQRAHGISLDAVKIWCHAKSVNLD